MKLILIFIFTAVFGSVVGQGLSYELSFNRDYAQWTNGVVAVGENTFFVKQQKYKNSPFGTVASLLKINSTGNVLWEYSLQTVFPAEYIEVTEIVPSQTGGVYMLGEVTPTCDVGGMGYTVLMKFDEDGGVLWSKDWFSNGFYSRNASGLNYSPSSNMLQLNLWKRSKIYTISPLGVVLDSCISPTNELQQIHQISDSSFLSYKADSLLLFDTTGSFFATYKYSQEIKGLLIQNNESYVLTSDSLFVVDAILNEISAISISGFGNYSNLRLINNTIEFISTNDSSTFIFTLNNQLQVLNSILIEQKLLPTDFIDYNDEHCAVSSNFSLVEHTSIRHNDYSRNSTANQFVNWTDIEVVDLVANVIDHDEIYYDEIGWFWTNRLQIDGTVTIRNNGPNPLNSFRLTRLYSQGYICNNFYYSEEFSNLNIGVGDSMSFKLGPIFNGSVDNPDTVQGLLKDLCIYSSHPNKKTDFVVENDQYCKNVFIPFEEEDIDDQDDSDSIVEVECIPQLIKVVDALGRETNIQYNTFQIYMYSDGSAKKVFIVE